jgi:exopolysaccharide biosynthesis polyprenyl glycosylphosphotransferase
MVKQHRIASTINLDFFNRKMNTLQANINSTPITSDCEILQAIELQNKILVEGLRWNLMSEFLTIGKFYLVKRCMDFVIAALFVFFTWPLYLVIALAIKLDSPGPVFFKQTRMGLHGKKFQVWKFRTMRTDAEKLQKELESRNETTGGVIFKIKNDPRITGIGSFLRRYSLDELPQLFNVLLGEMALVGPRPLPIRDVDNFSPHHFFRHEVLPGVTGLWQVSGRSNIVDFEQVIQLDFNYIENWSLAMDLRILMKTVLVVLKKEGAY